MAHLQINMPEDESWRQRCNKKMEKLREKFSRPEEEEEDDVYLNFHICEVIRQGDPDKFVDYLEGHLEKEKLSFSQVLGQATYGGDSMLHVAAKYGSDKIAELVASHHPGLLKAVNNKGNTALHDAARSTASGSNVFKVILSQHDARPGKKSELLPGFSSPIKTEITRSKNHVGNTALHEAVACGNLDGVTELYHRDKAAAHELNNSNKSPLYIAVYNYMRWNNNVKPDQRGEKNNKTAKAIVDCLLQDSLPISMPNPSWSGGQSPLHAAIEAVSDKMEEQSFVSIIEETLHRFCRIFDVARATADRQGSSKASLEELVKKRPEMIYIKDKNRRTPLHYAALNGYLDGVQVMLENYPLAALDTDVYGYLPIHLACKSGKIDVVKELHSKGPKVSSVGSFNLISQNILHAAAGEGKYDVVKFILKSEDIDLILNETDVNGNTPLHLASMNKHPMVLFYLTRDKRIDLQCQNEEGLTARDIVLQRSNQPMTSGELLSHAILKSASARHSKRGRTEIQPNDTNRMKDLVNTLMLVAILIATVTFAAGFTVPGSVYSSDDPNPERRGLAVLEKRPAFQVFMFCNTLAMYSSTAGSFVLLWAQLGDYRLASNSFNIALHMVAWALMTMSGAFMAAAYLVVHNVSWLAIAIRAIGAIYIFFILVAYIFFIFPLGSHHPLLRPISDIVFRILIPFVDSSNKVIPKAMFWAQGSQ